MTKNYELNLDLAFDETIKMNEEKIINFINEKLKKYFNNVKIVEIIFDHQWPNVSFSFEAKNLNDAAKIMII